MGLTNSSHCYNIEKEEMKALQNNEWKTGANEATNQVSIAVQKRKVGASFIIYTLQSADVFLFATYLNFNSCSGGRINRLKHDRYGMLSTEWHGWSVRWRTDSKLTLDRDRNTTGSDRDPCLWATANKRMYKSEFPGGEKDY